MKFLFRGHHNLMVKHTLKLLSMNSTLKIVLWNFGGARSRLAECGCASPADGAPGRPGPRVPAPRPPPRGSFPGAPGGRVTPPRRKPGRPPPSRAPGFFPRPDCARVVVAAAAARLLATPGK